MHAARSAETAANTDQANKANEALRTFWASIPSDAEKILDAAIQKVAVTTEALNQAQQEARGAGFDDARSKLTRVLMRLAEAGPALSRYVPRDGRTWGAANVASMGLQLVRADYDVVTAKAGKLERLAAASDPGLSEEERNKLVGNSTRHKQRPHKQRKSLAR